MFYQKELTFICSVFKKNKIDTLVTEFKEFARLAKEWSENGEFDSPWGLGELPTQLEKRTVYRFKDALDRCYLLLSLPATERETVLFVGPYFAERATADKFFKITEQFEISPQSRMLMNELYHAIPVIAHGSPLWTVIDSFCEFIWHAESFTVYDVGNDEVPVSSAMHNLSTKDTLINIKAVEHRYSVENEMIRAVGLGMTHLDTKFGNAFADDIFERRVADPLRNAKNYIIIMNTLLRKAAESGGVHPIHIDKASSEFAKKIEELPSLAAKAALMKEMFYTYSKLVRDHTLRQYSPIVKNTILIIESDLSADLSPHLLAEDQSVSLGYLSTVFKKETNQTISEYIRHKRMEYAAYLLRTTTLQIQTVALHCGIMDVQYFSKLFKKHSGKTPTDYRLEANHALHENEEK